jgi:glutathione S-transferase
MLELYHHGSSVCAAKVRLALNEKDLLWKSRYLDILVGDQFAAAYMRLNPRAVVPTLVHDGTVIVESTVICEYLDEVFPGIPLKPAMAAGRARMREWTKAVDEDLHPACAELTFVTCHRHIVRRLPPNEYAIFLASTPPLSVTPQWHTRKKELVEQGFAAPCVERTFQLYDSYLARMEQALARHDYLAGDSFSLADISLAPYVNRLSMLGMSALWTETRPRVSNWFERVRARPTFKPALLDWCPSDLTSDLLRFGSASWPQVKALLDSPAAARTL